LVAEHTNEPAPYVHDLENLALIAKLSISLKKAKRKFKERELPALLARELHRKK
jgi:hypothetical protein